MFQKALKFVLRLLVFLVPLFWLPYSVEAFTFNKVYLIAVLVLLGILLWLAKMIFKDKKISIKWTILDPFILAFLIVATVSSFLGVDKNASFMGFYGKFWPSLLGLWCLGGFYFLITNNIKKTEIAGILKTFFWSCLLMVIASYLAIFGVWGMIHTAIGHKLPNVMTLRTFSTIGGSLEELSLLLTCLTLALIAFLAFKKKQERGLVSYILLFASLGLLIMIDFTPAWIVMFLALLLFLVFSFWKRIFKEDVNRLSMATLFAVVAFIMIFISPVRNILVQTTVAGGLPSEVLLNQRTSWNLTWQGFKENWLLGAGPSNYHYVFAKFKPQLFLATDFWQLRFDRAGSYIAEMVAEMGALGALTYLALAMMFFLISYFFVASFKKKADKGSLQEGSEAEQEAVKEERKIAVIPLVVSFFAIFAAQFAYYQTVNLAFFFWLFLALGVVSWGESLRERSFSFKEFPEVGLVFSIIFWVALVAVAFLYFTLGKYYLADVYYREYLLNPTKNLVKLETSVRIAPSRTMYHIALSRAYLQKFMEEAVKTQPDKQLVAQLINGAVQESKVSVARSPKWVVVHENAGIVYREIRGAVQGAGDWAIKSFDEALKLEPKNPVVNTELGKIYLANNNTDKAREYFNKAVAQKKDYVDANLQLAFLDDKEGKTQEAQGRLEDLVRMSPFSVEAHFQLGRVYFNSAEYDNAAEQFQTALALFPNHSNSLYSLGLVYEKQGKASQALEMFNKVLELNPGNQDVEKKIADVKAGSAPAPAPEVPKEKETPKKSTSTKESKAAGEEVKP